MVLPSKTRPYIIDIVDVTHGKQGFTVITIEFKVLLLSLLNSVHQKCYHDVSFCVNA